MAPKAVSARKRLDRNHRFRGHGPLLHKAWLIPEAGGASTGGYAMGSPWWWINGGIYKGPSPCW